MGNITITTPVTNIVLQERVLHTFFHTTSIIKLIAVNRKINNFCPDIKIAKYRLRHYLSYFVL